jgi:hypothetical protein
MDLIRSGDAVGADRQVEKWADWIFLVYNQAPVPALGTDFQCTKCTKSLAIVQYVPMPRIARLANVSIYIHAVDHAPRISMS